MPPALALGLCALFVGIAFAVNGRRPPGVSAAINLPLAWLLVRGSRSVGAWIYAFSGSPGLAAGSELDSIAEGSAWDRYFLTAVTVWGLLVLLRRGIHWGPLLRQNRWIVFLYLLCLVSLAWSDFPYIGFKRFVRGFGLIVMCFIVVTEKDRIEAFRVLMRRAGYLLLPLSVVLIKYYREIGVLNDEFGVVIAGVTTGKNPLGLLTCLLGLFFWWSILSDLSAGRGSSPAGRRGLAVDTILFLAVLWIFYTANSATAFISFLFGCFIVSFLGLPAVRRNLAVVGLFAVVFGLVATPFIWAGYESLLSTSLEATGHIDTFWSRVRLWEVLLQEETNPLLGVGYDSFFLGERLRALSQRYWWFPTQAHNGYLQAYLELGVAGLFAWGMVLLSSYRSVIRGMSLNYQFGRLQLAYFATFLVYNLTETSFTLRSLQFYVFLLAVMSCDPGAAPGEGAAAPGRNPSP